MSEARSQAPDLLPESRAEQIEKQQVEKGASLDTAQSGKAPGKFEQVNHLIRHVPVRFAVEGLGPGAGAAAGSIFKRSSSEGRVTAKVWGVALLHGFYTAGAGFDFKSVSPRGMAFALEGSHADAPQLEYYGPGPDSSIHNRTDFRKEETLFNVRARATPGRHSAIACHAAELLLHIGPGTNSQLATTQSVFNSTEAPGIEAQTNYAIAGCSAQVDLRDYPGDPHKGYYAEAAYDRYHAQDDDRFSFYRLSNAAEFYAPFFNGKRLIALMAQTEFSFHSSDQIVPFYLQPTLASDTELRGFRRYRFYDENAIALSGEYRWEICTGFDMAIFIDGGKVFHEPGALALSGIESSMGFGLRVKNERRVVARLDAGFSREGFQIWLKAGRLF